jgi:hypothetical protein
MLNRFSRFIRLAAIIAILSLATAAAFAKGSKSNAVPVTGALTDPPELCLNCDTDIAGTNFHSPTGPGPYSLISDGEDYINGGGVQSTILTNGSVYTLDTMDTLDHGLVGSGTRTVPMHFFSSGEGTYPDNVLPACWGPAPGNHDQNQAVNWSIFSSNNTKLDQMSAGEQYPGFARLDFNVRNAQCNKQIYRYYLKWYAVCIEHPTLSTWVVTSDSCGRQTNYGEAGLYGQGGRKGQTEYYGDWRMPFQITLTK